MSHDSIPELRVILEKQLSFDKNEIYDQGQNSKEATCSRGQFLLSLYFSKKVKRFQHGYIL